MVKALDAACMAARKAQESLYYEGICTIVEYGSVTDEATKITRQGEVITVRDQPCRLSFETIRPVSQTETGAASAQAVKLFLAPEITVKAGSKIVVEQNGARTEYAASGEPARYATHQEVMLDLFRGWA